MADSERSQKIEQLQEQVNRRVREAVADLQRELRERLRRAGDQIVGEMDRELEKEAPELPSSFLSGDELAPLAEEAGSAARREAVSSLVSSLAAVDRAGSQGELLSTLLRETTHFAGRSALLLSRGDGLELWGSHGWDASLEGTRVDYADSGPWSREALGSGVGELATGDCGRLCSQVDAPLPQAGVLLPLVLRDRLAAVLYADHGEGEELLVEALQALTYAAALALETLPFRERAATPTLVRAGGAAAGTRLEVWSSAAAAPGEEAAADQDETLDQGAAEGEASDDELAAAGFAFTGEDDGEKDGIEDTVGAGDAIGGEETLGGEDEEEEDLYAGDFDLDDEDTEEVDLDGPDLAGDLDGEDLGSETFDSEDLEGEDLEAEDLELDGDQPGDPGSRDLEAEDLVTEDLETEDLGAEDTGDGMATDDLAVGYGDAADTADDEAAGAGADWREEAVEAPQAEDLEREQPPSEPVERGDWSTDDAGEESDLQPERRAAGFDSSQGYESTQGFESPLGIEAPAAPPPPAFPETIEPEDETADLAPSAVPAAAVPPSAAPQPAAPPFAPPPSAPSPGAGGSEVAPPSDVQGPGRAFGAAEPVSEDEARHEEARRLARLLVSEIRLYNEEEVDEGRRNNDVYARLKEDIDRSRQMYEERVDPAIRDSTDYFYQELVRNLGGGDEKTLGL